MRQIHVKALMYLYNDETGFHIYREQTKSATDTM